MMVSVVLLWSALVAPALEPELIGQPAFNRELATTEVTGDEASGWVAWGIVQGEDQRGVAGIRLADGSVIFADLTRLGNGNVRLTKGVDGNLYVFAGVPGRFVRVNPADGTWVELGIPDPKATYWLTPTFTSDGRMIIGAYPTTNLLACDTRTGEVTNLGKMTEDSRQLYVTKVCEAADGVIYAAVGLHHRELVAMRPDGQRQQILPEELTRTQGAPDIWLAADGQVYGKVQSSTFRCLPTGIELIAEPPAAVSTLPRRTAGDRAALQVQADGQLRLQSTVDNTVSYLPTQWRGVAVRIYSVGPLHEGKLWGSGLKLGNLWEYEPATGAIVDHGVVTTGTIQIYDILPHRGKLWLASYFGAGFDVMDPTQPVVKRRNPAPLGSLYAQEQERPNQLVVGPDGMVYSGTVPAKGRLGGGVARINPETGTLDFFRGMVPEQSIMSLVSLDEAGELLLASSVQGGSSAKPTATEALLAHWRPDTNEVTATAQPLPGCRSYGMMVRAANRLVYGIGAGSWYAYDPARREVVASGKLPSPRHRFPGLHDTPVGPRGLVVGVVGDLVFAIDPATNSVATLGQHASLNACHGFWVTDDGMLYYGSGSSLYRVKLPMD